MKLHAWQLRCRLVLIVIFLVSDPEAYTLRVLAAFTEQAEAYGFSPYVAAEGINGIVGEVYENSSPTYSGYEMPKVELAGTVKVSYTGTNTTTAKKALRSKIDNKMDEIHALRDWYRADIVILFHPFTNSGGEAYDVDINHENEAFAVVTVPFYSSAIIAHEIGHLVGCIHNDQDPIFVYPSIEYAYGYVGPANAWGTVMTYHSNRKRWFSNPYETFNGAARGIADSADCTRKHHERKATLSGYRATVNAPTISNVDLDTNESMFWDVTGHVHYLNSQIRPEALVSLKSTQDVHFLGFPHSQITSEGAVYLKSSQTVELSGIHKQGSFVGVIADSLHFSDHTETIFRSAVAILNANVVRHFPGGSATIEKDSSNSWGSLVWIFARHQIRLTTGFKIKSENVFMHISDSYNPFDSTNGWEPVLPKPSVAPDNASPAMSASFQSRLIQERGDVSLEYRLSERGPLSVRVMDLKGRLAGSVDVRHPRSGVHTVAIPGRFRNGTVYFVRVTANGNVQTHRFVKGL